MDEETDIQTMVAYAIQEQRKLNCPYTAKLLALIPTRMQENESIKARLQKSKLPLIRSEHFPDDLDAIVRLQVQMFENEAKQGVPTRDFRVYVWDKPEARQKAVQTAWRDGYYQPFSFWLHRRPEDYKSEGSESLFEQFVEHLKAHRNDDWWIGPMYQRGINIGVKGQTRYPDHGALVQPDMSLTLIIRDRAFEFGKAKICASQDETQRQAKTARAALQCVAKGQRARRHPNDHPRG
jgi:hypothetical protein